MKYYLRNPNDQVVTGPFELDQIGALLKAGEISTNTLARSEHLTRESWPAKWPPASEPDWLPLRRIPRFAGHISLQDISPPVPPSVPETPALVAVAQLADSDEIRFCPGCAHPLPTPLPPGETGVCKGCGRTLGFAPPPPPLPPAGVTLLPIGESKSRRVLAGVGKALGTVFIFLLCLIAGLFMFTLLMLIVFGSKCRA